MKDISPVLRELADRVEGLRTPDEQSLTRATFELAKEVYERLEYDKSPEYAEAFMRRYVRLLDYARTATRGRFFGWFFTAKDTARYLRHLADMLGVQKRKPERRKTRKRAKRTIPTEPDLAGFVPADTLAHDHGISKSRLSEAARSGKVRTHTAARGTLSSQGRKVRVLYNEAEAIKHCSSKRRV